MMRRWICSQIGGREYYAIPRMLRQFDALESLFTDIWVPTRLHSLVRRVSPKLAARSSPGLNGVSVHSQPLAALYRAAGRKHENRFERWTTEGKAFSRWVSDTLCRKREDESLATFGYTCANLETMWWAKANGALAIHGQVDPGLAWYRTLEEETRLWPDAAAVSSTPSQEFVDRIVEEWAVADWIVVNSTHSRSGLIDFGVNCDKIVVLPLCYENHAQPATGARIDFHTHPFTVLFVGTIGLAKGFPYFARASSMLGSGFKFKAAGGVELRQSFLTSLIAGPRGPVVELLGILDRNRLAQEFQSADVLVFPTLSDGFGMVQLEAQSWGKPVIATANAGTVVADGESGFIVPARDPAAIAACLQTLREDAYLYQAMSRKAVENAARFSLARVGALLHNSFQDK